MRPRRLMPFAAAILVAASCTSKDAAPGGARGDGATAHDSLPASSDIPWVAAAQPLLLVPAHSNDRALVIAADSLAPDMEDGTITQPVSLLRLDGSILAVRATLSSSSEGCVDAALQPPPASGWGVGIVGGTPEALRVDSLRAIARDDSVALARGVFRLASGVPNAPGGRFQGLPFSLVDLWRLRAPDGSVVVIATTKRQINQEDSPLEERTLIVAESDSSGTLSLMHSKRSTGAEETVEGSDLLAAITTRGRPELDLVFAHDYGDEGSYTIVERAARGRWSVRWTSRRVSC
jgi:hypothetical protein